MSTLTTIAQEIHSMLTNAESRYATAATTGSRNILSATGTKEEDQACQDYCPD